MEGVTAIEEEKTNDNKQVNVNNVNNNNTTTEMHQLFNYDNNNLKMVLKELPAITAAGSMAGVVADICTHPFDTLRARLQVLSHESKAGFIEVGKGIVKREGVGGMYRGFSTVLSFTIPAHALYFFGYEFCKASLQPTVPLHLKSPLVHFTSGMIADLCGSLIWVPMDVIKQRQQVYEDASTISVMRQIYKADGLRGFWRGFLPAIATYGPFVGIYFTTYEQSKLLFGKFLSMDSQELPMYSHLIGGGIAGTLAAGITCPLDVIKTRIQVQSASQKGSYKGGIDAFKKIVRAEGFSALYNGLAPRILWIAPGCAITIASYEKFKNLFGG